MASRRPYIFDISKLEVIGVLGDRAPDHGEFVAWQEYENGKEYCVFVVGGPPWNYGDGPSYGLNFPSKEYPGDWESWTVFGKPKPNWLVVKKPAHWPEHTLAPGPDQGEVMERVRIANEKLRASGWPENKKFVE